MFRKESASVTGLQENILDTEPLMGFRGRQQVAPWSLAAAGGIEHVLCHSAHRGSLGDMDSVPPDFGL